MKKTLFIFLNPDFDEKFQCGVSRLYQIFVKKHNFNIEFIDDEFLENNTLENQTLVIAGGDGTIHRVLNTIPDNMLEQYTFGIIPAGTANEFTRFLKLPFVVEDAAEVIAKQEKTTIQTPGIINQKYKFMTGFLYGIASKVLQETSHTAKHYLGQYAYQLPGLLSLVDYGDFVRRFKVDSLEFDTGYLLINNLSLLSKDILPDYVKDEESGAFSVIFLNPELNAADLLGLMIKNQTGGNILEDPFVFYQQMRELTLEFDGNINFLLDGEIYGLDSPINFQQCEQNMSVII